MYFFNLGGSPLDDKTGDQIAVSGVPVDDIWRVYRWGNSDYVDFRNGLNLQGQVSFASVWAVRDGDSAQVPEPVSAILLAIGLIAAFRSGARGRFTNELAERSRWDSGY
jgi:hypothetical protein